MSKSNRVLIYTILIILISIPIFCRLTCQPFREYDEARVATNVYEMSKNGNWLVTYFNGEPEMWNTKPPLLIWLQVVFSKLFGFGELAIRLPIAIAALLTCILLFRMCAKYLKDEILGIIAALVLVTTSGYIHVHVSRTGDYDGLLILFAVWAYFSFFLFLETKQQKFLYHFFLALTLGVLTKSIVILLFLPAIAVYSLWQKQFAIFFKNKHFYVGLFAFLLISIGYYNLRELYNPGYIEAVQLNEWGGRYLKTLEEHKEDFWFYYNKLQERDFGFSFWYLIPCGLIVGILAKDKKLFRFTVFLTLLILSFFLSISTASTKIYWYSAPLFPFLALLVAIFFRSIVTLLMNVDYKSYLNHNLFPVLFLFFILILPYQQVVHNSYESEEYGWDVDRYRMSYYLKANMNTSGTENRLNNYKVLNDGWGWTNLNLYIKMLQDRGVNVSGKDFRQLTPGDIVITGDPQVKTYVGDHYNFKIIEDYKGIAKYEITGSK